MGREDPFLKLLSKNLKKDEKMHIDSFYFKLLSISCITITLPFIAVYSYNLLLFSSINLLFFIVYIIKNFLKYRRTQTVDIYIESKNVENYGQITQKEHEQQQILEKDKLRIREDECYDDDTDEYDVIASGKEDDDQTEDDEILNDEK